MAINNLLGEDTIIDKDHGIIEKTGLIEKEVIIERDASHPGNGPLHAHELWDHYLPVTQDKKTLINPEVEYDIKIPVESMHITPSVKLGIERFHGGSAEYVKLGIGPGNSNIGNAQATGGGLSREFMEGSQIYVPALAGKRVLADSYHGDIEEALEIFRQAENDPELMEELVDRAIKGGRIPGNWQERELDKDYGIISAGSILAGVKKIQDPTGIVDDFPGI